VVQLGTTWVNTFAHLGYLSRVPASIFRPAITGWLNDICTYESKHVAQPWFMEIRSLLIREVYLQKLNLSPEIVSCQEFMNLCREIAEKQRNKWEERILPFAFSVRPESELLHRVISWHLTKGRCLPELAQGNNRILSSTSCKKTLDFVSRLVRVSRISPEELQRHPYKLYMGFVEGSYMFFQGAWEIRLPDSVNTSDYGLVPMPVSDNEPQYWGGGSVLAVSAASREKELSWRLIKFITEDEMMESWVKYSNDLPAFSCDFWDKYSHIENVKLAHKQAINSISYPVHPLWASIEKGLSTGLSNYFWHRFIEGSGKNKLDRVLEEADARIRNLLKFSW
ncbi:MAG: hypothetical protein ACOC5A_01400, partial [Halanaerobiales bacterium]